MERRSFIRNISVAVGTTMLFPGCLNHSPKSALSLDKIDVDQEELLAEIAATIIPKTDTPGAREVGAHLFVVRMLNDCYEKEKQDNFIQGLEELKMYTRQQYGQSFEKCSNIQREKILQSIENKEIDNPPLVEFYSIMKAKTIQAYMTSKYVIHEIKHYEIIPSVKYNGYYPLKNT
ncbi:gluconate 2-dehydrogenase subunit 3 family protein [Pedobacter immunditicola]|uniref:gluconate 2-dehydrogenase subunit 3 family protein n=1 Tax=Pedobacter immunditicola TaxID=3133440 RepID=UPI0030AEFBC8